MTSEEHVEAGGYVVDPRSDPLSIGRDFFSDLQKE